MRARVSERAEASTSGPTSHSTSVVATAPSSAANRAVAAEAAAAFEAIVGACAVSGEELADRMRRSVASRSTAQAAEPEWAQICLGEANGEGQARVRRGTWSEVHVVRGALGGIRWRDGS